MTAPQCSVIIPAYNAIEFLPDAIASVLAQGVAAIEILVCDDGSSDGTLEWLVAAAAREPRIRVFRGGRLGPAKARNYLIDNAKSGLVAFLDADDTWLPGKLAGEISYHAENPDVVFSFTDYRHVDMAGNLRSTAFGYWQPEWKPAGRDFTVLADARNELLATNAVGTSCVVAKREFLQIANGFAAQLPSAEDWDLWLRLALLGPVAVSSAVTMHYLMRPGSETSNRAARINAMQTVVEDNRKSSASTWAVRHARSRILTSKAQWMHQSDKQAWACALAWAAFVLRPGRRALREALAFSRDVATGQGLFRTARPSVRS
ncbi:MAG: glycosyltransferase family 2 protein [Nitratireductor sp.]|nr:glycosyltransferase family 2 protein [Nitratireductor sp.]MCB1457598.1 glycosyltransferase family 2 protein [Nitratireductor sp.]MCB1458259.1 glycosyltransferase family 2 protein [Nitratireductor sp.]